MERNKEYEMEYEMEWNGTKWFALVKSIICYSYTNTVTHM